MIYEGGDFRKFRTDELPFKGAYSPLVEGTRPWKSVAQSQACSSMLSKASVLVLIWTLSPPRSKAVRATSSLVLGPLHGVKSAAAMIQKRVDELAVNTRDPAEAFVAESAWEACTANSQAARPRVWVYALGVYTPRNR